MRSGCPVAVDTRTADGERCLRVTNSRGKSEMPAPVSTKKSNLVDPTLAATLSSGRPSAAFTACRGSFPSRNAHELGWVPWSYFYWVCLATCTSDGTYGHQAHRRGGRDIPGVAGPRDTVPGPSPNLCDQLMGVDDLSRPATFLARAGANHDANPRRSGPPPWSVFARGARVHRPVFPFEKELNRAERPEPCSWPGVETG